MYGDGEGDFGTNSSPFHSMCGCPIFESNPFLLTDIANAFSSATSSKNILKYIQQYCHPRNLFSAMASAEQMQQANAGCITAAGDNDDEPPKGK